MYMDRNTTRNEVEWYTDSALTEAMAEDEQAHWEDDPDYMALYFPEV